VTAVSIPVRANSQQAGAYANRPGPATGRDCQVSLPAEGPGGKPVSRRPGSPRTPVTGSASRYGPVSTHRRAPGRPSTPARGTRPMIAEVTSCSAGGRSAAGADRPLPLPAWIHSTPRREGCRVRSTPAWSPAAIRHARGFMTLITRAGSAVTGRSQPRPPARAELAGASLVRQGAAGGPGDVDDGTGSGPSFHRAAPSLLGLKETIQSVWYLSTCLSTAGPDMGGRNVDHCDRPRFTGLTNP
jgi:hypothetical protein